MTNTRQHSAPQWGCFGANQMPFGLQNALTDIQRLMFCCFGDLNFTHLLIYLDDLIKFSKTFDEHLERLQLVFDRLKEHGAVSGSRGVRKDPQKISSVKDWVRPTNCKEVLQFLGFAGYYRQYVSGYSPCCSLIPPHYW